MTVMGFEVTDSSAEGVTTSPVYEVIQVSGVTPSHEDAILSFVTKRSNDTLDGFEETDTSAGGTHIIPIDD